MQFRGSRLVQQFDDLFLHFDPPRCSRPVGNGVSSRRTATILPQHSQIRPQLAAHAAKQGLRPAAPNQPVPGGISNEASGIGDWTDIGPARDGGGRGVLCGAQWSRLEPRHASQAIRDSRARPRRRPSVGRPGACGRCDRLDSRRNLPAGGHLRARPRGFRRQGRARGLPRLARRGRACDRWRRGYRPGARPRPGSSGQARSVGPRPRAPGRPEGPGHNRLRRTHPARLRTHRPARRAGALLRWQADDPRTLAQRRMGHDSRRPRRQGLRKVHLLRRPPRPLDRRRHLAARLLDLPLGRELREGSLDRYADTRDNHRPALRLLRLHRGPPLLRPERVRGARLARRMVPRPRDRHALLLAARQGQGDRHRARQAAGLDERLLACDSARAELRVTFAAPRL